MEILLRKQILEQYDIQACKEEVNSILTEYIRAKYAYFNVKKQGDSFYGLSSAKNQDLIVSKSNTNSNDSVTNKVIYKIDNEIKAEQLKKDIEELYTKFTDQEKDFFDYVLLNGDAQRIVEDKYRITKSGLEPIKQSCIVKSALHFGVAIMK